MAKLNWQNEDSGEVFVRGSISSQRGRSYSTSQELGSPTFLPSSDFRRHSELQRYGQFGNDWIRRGLFGDRLRPAREEVRPLGRRINSCAYAKNGNSDYIKTRIGNEFVRTRDSYDWIRG